MPEKNPAREPASSVEDELARLSAEIGRRKARGEDAADLIAAHRAMRATAAPQARPRASSEGVGLCVSICDQASDFEQLRDEWRELVEDGGACSPFLTWERLCPWWDLHRTGRRLLLLLARDETGRLVGIAPLMVERGQLGRCLALIGTGGGSPRADSLAFVLRRGTETAAADALAAEMLRCSDRWDYAHLRHVGWEDHAQWLIRACARVPKVRCHLECEAEGGCDDRSDSLMQVSLRLFPNTFGGNRAAVRFFARRLLMSCRSRLLRKP